MTVFHTRDIRNVEQLEKKLKNEYLGKGSTAHLQIEFNSLKQEQGKNKTLVDV